MNPGSSASPYPLASATTEQRDDARVLVFGTLGPTGSNHEFVLRRYLSFHGLDLHARIELFLDFHDGARRLIDGAVDFILQVAVHPDAADVVAAYRRGMFVIDAFVSGSRPMAVVCRRDVGVPKTLALQPATRAYVDASRFETLIAETSTASVAQGLIDGRYEAGITYTALVEAAPERFRIEEDIGTVDDAWMVFGRAPVTEGALVADRRGPAALRYANLLESNRRI